MGDSCQPKPLEVSMYCPHCGTESSGELNYCKRCGGSLNPLANAPQQQVRAPVPAGTAWAMGTTMLLLIVLGLGVLFAAVAELSHSGAIPPVLVLMVIFGALTILGGATLLTWLWTRVLGTSSAAGNAPQFGRQPHTNELPHARVSALPDAHIPSVTEHTTRTFDNIKR
ncbi:MAG: hypothetical protein LC802_03445 [Acidobacteria bacterium]|nr:hypothetical protein [Acidobacteriota bacterium]